MGKVSGVGVSCVVLVALVGFSVPAYALVDPVCEPVNIPDEFGLSEFSVDSTDTHRGYAVSGIAGAGLACGSKATSATTYEGGGSGSQFVRAEIEIPPGVKINSTAGMEWGAYVGQAEVNFLTWRETPLDPIFIDGYAVSEVAVITVDDSGPDCPADAVACYRGDMSVPMILKAHNWSWVTGDAESGYKLTIGELYNGFGLSPAGLTRIREFSFCDYAGDMWVPGDPSSRSCGDGSDPTQWLQKNGDPWVFIGAVLGGDRARPHCPGGLGLYKATATTRGSSLDPQKTTELVESCVAWTGFKRFKKSPFGTAQSTP